ncbi:hypothetical protein H7F51_14650 [Novosphingobium flavum]|uniref:DUF5681 domain-containing protein n=1 Tax=Novosphingobium flavum TaxID=1778672 RepID=A0A7X1FUU4_9SPHN|nr:DUF5681 domain-containing protein [Novosphingobium flavum]MBC2666757.1 hypothetical protein [Novosphingobium flavum]
MTQKSASSDQPVRPPVRQRVRPVPSAPATEPRQTPRQPVPPKGSGQTPAASGNAASDEAVGYCNPPRHSRFKPGFDARRPRGRKPGSKNKASAIVAMMESPTVLRTPEGGIKTVSTAEALARKLRELGLTGQLPAIAKAFELYHKALPPAAVEPGASGGPSVQSPDEISAADQAILAAFEAEIAARISKGEKK